MNRHAKRRILNRIVRPILGLFEALWMAVKDAFKAIDDAHHNDLFKP